jgi:LacI family transcriptional regulator
MKKPTAAPVGVKKRATLKTISQLTGLSQSTVSLSLRGGASLREETLKRVAEAAAQVGYVPDRAGVRLRTGKTNVIALVLNRADDSIDFARYLIQGIGHGIKNTLYHMNVTPNFDSDSSVETVRYIIDNRTADGVVLTHTSPRDPRVQLLMDHDFPFVTHGRTEFYSPHPYHDFHSEEFMRLAVERLHAKGCRNIMLVVGGRATTNFSNIVNSFERTALRLKVESRVTGEETGRGSPAAMRSFGQELAADPNRPDGIICDSEVRSICLITGLVDGGVKVGRDIQFICKQTSDLLSTLFPSIDTIEENVFEAGMELTRLLIRRIKGDAPELLQTLGEPVTHWRD